MFSRIFQLPNSHGKKSILNEKVYLQNVVNLTNVVKLKLQSCVNDPKHISTIKVTPMNRYINDRFKRDKKKPCFRKLKTHLKHDNCSQLPEYYNIITIYNKHTYKNVVTLNNCRDNSPLGFSRGPLHRSPEIHHRLLDARKKNFCFLFSFFLNIHSGNDEIGGRGMTRNGNTRRNGRRGREN